MRRPDSDRFGKRGLQDRSSEHRSRLHAILDQTCIHQATANATVAVDTEMALERTRETREKKRGTSRVGNFGPEPFRFVRTAHGRPPAGIKINPPTAYATLDQRPPLLGSRNPASATK